MSLMDLTRIQPLNDTEFDKLYAEKYREHSYIHWTPIEVAKAALDWLDITAESKVLDIGSGVGKFCSLGALLTNGQFTGVEKRRELVKVAKSTIKNLELRNVQYVHSNITKVDFTQFNSFYYYNPFCEQIYISGQIDNTISYSPNKYRMYEDYVINQFSDLPIDTKVVTYCSQNFTFPDTYELKGLLFDGTLALWIKTKEK